jgi:hypothetical protein
MLAPGTQRHMTKLVNAAGKLTVRAGFNNQLCITKIFSK